MILSSAMFRNTAKKRISLPSLPLSPACVSCPALEPTWPYSSTTAIRPVFRNASFSPEAETLPHSHNRRPEPQGHHPGSRPAQTPLIFLHPEIAHQKVEQIRLIVHLPQPASPRAAQTLRVAARPPDSADTGRAGPGALTGGDRPGRCYWWAVWIFMHAMLGGFMI